MGGMDYFSFFHIKVRNCLGLFGFDIDKLVTILGIKYFHTNLFLVENKKLKIFDLLKL